MKLIGEVMRDLFGLVYPNVCVTCGKPLPRGCLYLCPGCLYRLPRTHFHKDRDNPLAMTFWGRVPIEHAAAWFQYTKGSLYPRLIYVMKYSGRRDIARVMGRFYAAELKDSPLDETHLIVPIPLHPRKERKRGYNQSEWIGRGLSEGLDKPLECNLLRRTVNTRTQTKKSRLERWKNVENVFRVAKPDALQHKHVLLVDDVVTTGATLESATVTLLQIPGVRVSIAALAYANF